MKATSLHATTPIETEAPRTRSICIAIPCGRPHACWSSGRRGRAHSPYAALVPPTEYPSLRARGRPGEEPRDPRRSARWITDEHDDGEDTFLWCCSPLPPDRRPRSPGVTSQRGLSSARAPPPTRYVCSHGEKRICVSVKLLMNLICALN